MSERLRHVRRTDYILFSLRLVLLVVTGVVVASSPYLSAPLVWLFAGLFALFVVNGVLIVLLLLRIGVKWNIWLQVGTDLALALFAYLLTQSSDGVVVWLLVFPVVIAALTPHWWGSLIIGAGMPLFYAGLFILIGPDKPTNSLTLLGQTFLMLELLALITGFAHANRGGRRGAVRDEALAQRAQDDARSQVRIIYDMAANISTTLDPNKVLDIALELAETGVRTLAGEPAERMISMALLEQGNALAVGRARHIAEEDLLVSISGRRGAVGQALKTGATTQLPEPYNDPELKELASVRAAHSLLCVPLRIGTERLGVMLFAHPQPNFFTRDRADMLQAICNQTVVAFQNARLYQTLVSEKERIVEVEEEARKKLARDLHDGPTQQVAALAMRTNFIRRLVERDPNMAVEELYKVEELARRTTKEIRQMLFTLRPLILESQGLVAALHSLAEKMHENHNQNVIVQAEPGIDDRLEKHAQGVLFYIIEEAIGNARKHAEAEHIWVRLRLESPDMLRLDIEDDGVGFNVGEVDASYDQRTSLGMVNMRERTELINGQLKIQSAVGKGTRIRIRIPLTEEAREKLHAV